MAKLINKTNKLLLIYIIKIIQVISMQPKLPLLLQKQAIKDQAKLRITFSQPYVVPHPDQKYNKKLINNQSINSSIITPTTNSKIQIIQSKDEDEKNLPAKKSILKKSTRSKGNQSGTALKSDLNNMGVQYSRIQTIKKQLRHKEQFYTPNRKFSRNLNEANSNNINSNNNSILQSNYTPTKKIQQKKQNKQQIQTVFRYCFACQENILQSNMDIHQQKCPNFSQLYSKTQYQIMKMLLDKINRIKSQIKLILDETYTQQYSINKLQQKMALLLENSEKIQKQGYVNMQFQQCYKSVKELCYCPQVKLIELSYKLRWFLKIREQIKQKFDI